MMKSKGAITIEASIVMFIVFNIIVISIYLCILEYQKVLILSIVQINMGQNYSIEKEILKNKIKIDITNKSILKYKNLEININKEDKKSYQNEIVSVVCEYNLFQLGIINLNNKLVVPVGLYTKKDYLYYRK